MARIGDYSELIRARIPAHPNACADDGTRMRHESFILRNVSVGVLALVLVPLWLAAGYRSDVSGVLGLGVLSLLAPVAMIVSRSGNIVLAQALQSLVLGAFVGLVMARTGGVLSPAVLALAVLPFEAVLSGSRRMVLAAIAVSLAVVCAVGAIQLSGFAVSAGTSGDSGQVVLGGVTALLLAHGFALALEFDGVGRRTRSAERDRQVLHDAVCASMAGAVSIHDPSGAIRFVTPSINDLLAVAEGEVLGDGLFARVHVADRPAYLKALSDAAADLRPTGVEIRVRRGVDGDVPGAGRPEFIWLEMVCKPMAAAAGPAGGLVVMMHDISSRKQHETELQDARESAAEASRLRTRFLANVSHELRTPLNAIIGFSDLINTEAFGPVQNEKYREYINLIHDSGAHLLTVVNDILDLSKLEAGKVRLASERFAAATVIKDCVDMTMPQAREAGVRVVVLDPSGDDSLVADRRALRQILINLLSNAIKFTGAGGTVTVGVARSGQELTVTVADTGIGVAPDDLDNLGKPFFQTDNALSQAVEGTGLGLSVVKGLTELHGGRLRFTSELGVGTTVAVCLPAPANSDQGVPLAESGAEAGPVVAEIRHLQQRTA